MHVEPRGGCSIRSRKPLPKVTASSSFSYIRSRKPLPKVTASPSSHDCDWPKGEVKHKTSPRHQRDLTFLYQIIIKKTLRCALLISYRVGKNYAIFRAPEVVPVVCQISAAACVLGSSASVFGSGVYQIPISIRPFGIFIAQLPRDAPELSTSRYQIPVSVRLFGLCFSPEL